MTAISSDPERSLIILIQRTTGEEKKKEEVLEGDRNET